MHIAISSHREGGRRYIRDQTALRFYCSCNGRLLHFFFLHESKLSQTMFYWSHCRAASTIAVFCRLSFTMQLVEIRKLAINLITLRAKLLRSVL